MTDTIDVQQLLSLAYDLLNEGRNDDAERAFRRLTAIAPNHATPWYELGLLCKYQLRWAESLEYNRKSAYLDPSDQAAWWNMGIAATAAANWAAAREAWEQCGISLPRGDDAPEADFGTVPIRLDPDGAGEVVWTRRIDPARAIIENVPLPFTGYRWRDIVLHDGAPVGYRSRNGQDIPVFNALQRIQASAFDTYVVELASSDDASISRLMRIAEDYGGFVENWGTTTRAICRDCSYGRPHQHDHDNAPAYPHCGLAATTPSHAARIIDAWLAQTANADMIRWYPASDSN